MTMKEMKEKTPEGIRISKTDDEYRVSVIGENEAKAYYTDDMQDALNTANQMVRNGVKIENSGNGKYRVISDKYGIFDNCSHDGAIILKDTISNGTYHNPPNISISDACSSSGKVKLIFSNGDEFIGYGKTYFIEKVKYFSFSVFPGTCHGGTIHNGGFIEFVENRPLTHGFATLEKIENVDYFYGNLTESYYHDCGDEI